jgi:hypothetical protein
MSFERKYLKYKSKYLNLKYKMRGGSKEIDKGFLDMNSLRDSLEDIENEPMVVDKQLNIFDVLNPSKILAAVGGLFGVPFSREKPPLKRQNAVGGINEG